jgi:hypothetical protein
MADRGRFRADTIKSPSPGDGCTAREDHGLLPLKGSRKDPSIEERTLCLLKILFGFPQIQKSIMKKAKNGTQSEGEQELRKVQDF